MGAKLTKEYFETKLVERFSFQNAFAEVDETEGIKTRFISSSIFVLAKKNNEYGVLIDDKKWISNHIYACASTLHGNYTIPVQDLDKIIATSNVEKQVTISGAECSLIFEVPFHGKWYPCILQDKIFRHDIVLQPEYEKVVTLTAAAKM